MGRQRPTMGKMPAIRLLLIALTAIGLFRGASAQSESATLLASSASATVALSQSATPSATPEPLPPVAHGVHLAWDDGIGPAEYNKLLGRNATIFGDFFDVGSSPLRDQKYNFTFCANRMMKHAQKVLDLGYNAAYSIAVMPWEGLQYWGKNCSDGTYSKLNCSELGSTGTCTTIKLNCTGGDPMYPNGYTRAFLALVDQLVDMGLPVIIRWGHEMNGNWYPWGDQAALFVRVWKEFVDLMRPETRKAVIMEWAPNAVPDCEWRPATYDPYLPFYPGDDYVDVVGMSIYFYGTEDHTINEVAPADTLTKWMDSVSLVNGKTYPICQNYARMSVNNSKPFFFSETAAAYHVGKPGPTALQIKQAWWRQLYNSDTWRKYNHTRAIVWFEIRKQEWGDDRDFRLVLNQTTSGIMDAWLKDIPVDEMSWGGGTDRCDRVWFEQLRSVDKVAEGSVVKAGCALPTTSALAVETGTATLAVVTPSGSASATEGVAGLSTTRVGSAGKIQIPLFGLLLTILAAML